jgi:hypothetical protein
MPEPGLGEVVPAGSAGFGGPKITRRHRRVSTGSRLRAPKRRGSFARRYLIHIENQHDLIQIKIGDGRNDNGSIQIKDTKEQGASGQILVARDSIFFTRRQKEKMELPIEKLAYTLQENWAPGVCTAISYS